MHTCGLVAFWIQTRSDQPKSKCSSLGTYQKAKKKLNLHTTSWTWCSLVGKRGPHAPQDYIFLTYLFVFGRMSTKGIDMFPSRNIVPWGPYMTVSMATSINSLPALVNIQLAVTFLLFKIQPCN